MNITTMIVQQHRYLLTARPLRTGTLSGLALCISPIGNTIVNTGEWVSRLGCVFKICHARILGWVSVVSDLEIKIRIMLLFKNKGKGRGVFKMDGGGGVEECDHSKNKQTNRAIKEIKKEGLRLFNSEYKTRDCMQRHQKKKKKKKKKQKKKKKIKKKKKKSGRVSCD